MKTQFILTAFLIFTISNLFTQNTYIVNSTANFQDANPGDGICDNGSGLCTLRAAMEEANQDNVATNIHFNIPGTGPHFINLPAGTFNPLPGIFDFNPLTIDANTQPGNNPTSGQIILQGNNMNENGFEIFTTSPVQIFGMQIQFCNTAITTSMTSGEIDLIVGTTNKGNILVDNLTGVGLFVDGNVTIEGNLIGTDLTGIDRGNGEVGISLGQIFNGLNAIIKDNIINFNGTGMSTTCPTDISNNEIASNDTGISVGDPSSNPATISQNSMFCNINAIFLNTALNPPSINTANTTQISGSGVSGDFIEVFVHDDTGCSGIQCQGKTFVGSTVVSTGVWTLNGSFPLNGQITATATGTNGITTEFSNCVTVLPPPCSVEIQYSSTQNPGINSGNLAQDCPGDLITLFANPSPAGSYDANWIFPSGTTDCCTSGSIFALEEGEYVLVVTETASGCMAMDTITVNYFNQPSVNITTTPTNSFCALDPVNATLTATGGFAAYDWSNGGGSQSISVTTTGDFTVTATNSNGCFDTATETISQLPPVALDVCVSLNGGTLICDAVVTACLGDLIEISAVDGNGNIGSFDFYTWSNGQSGTDVPTITVTNAGVYEVIATDSNCKGIESVEIIFANPTAAVPSDFSVCEGQNIQLQEFGGDAIQWNWSGPNSFISFSQNPIISGAILANSGTYFVTITDINGCTDTDNLVVTVDPAPTAFISGNPTNICEGDNVNLQIDFTGTPPFIFEYSINGTGQSPMSTSNSSFSFIENPTQNTDYELISVSDNTNCNGITSGIVSVSITAFPTANTATVENCDDGTGNSIFDLTQTENTVNGGSGLPVSWWEDAGLAIPITNPTNYSSSGGSVFATVTDNSCESAPAEVFLIVSTANLTNCLELTPVSMVNGNDGVASIDVIGNSAPYSYSLSPGGANGNFNSNGNHTISDLSADTYTLTLINNLGCSYDCSFTITEPDCSNFSVILNGLDVNCFSGNDGAITSTINNGSGNYNFDWANPTINGIQNPTNLTADNYGLTLTDNTTGCITTSFVTINEPTSAVTATISNSQNVDCFGNATGSATVFATGGTITGDYSYNWSNGEMTAINSGLTAQIYTVTVTDDNGCSAITSIEITQPNELTASVSTTDETAFNANDGTAMANPSGGTMPFSYNWSNTMSTQIINNLPPADYFVTITDDNNCTATSSGVVNPFICTPISILINKNDVTCNGFDDGDAMATATGDNPPFVFNWSNGVMNNNMVSNLPPGTYTITATDAANCQETAQVTILEPVALTVSISKTDETANNANNGIATANPIGGTMPYFYNWSNGEMNQTISNLPPDIYTVTVTDSNGCTNIQSTTINPFGCGFINPSLLVENITCFGDDNGIATASANGVNPPFTFNWSNGQTGNSINNLPPDNYTLTVTDATNCDTILNFVIIEPNELTVSVSTTNETAFNANDGTATSIPIGGTIGGDYAYNWSNLMSTQTISNLSPADYFVTITDDNNCTATSSGVVNPFICTPISILINKSDITCNGFDDGDAMATATGDNPPFTFDWSNGITNNNTISDLPPGTYTVTATDAANCQETAQVTIVEPDLLNTAISKTDETANNANDGTATANPTGGTAPISYNWSNGQTSQSISNLPPDDYSVTITDANNCTSTATTTINPFGCGLFNASLLVENITCFGENDGMATASANGDNPPFAFNWSNGQTGNSINNLPPDDYILTITDNANCDTIINFVVIEPDLLNAAISKTDETANNANDGTAIANSVGGTAPISYNWSNGQTSQSISNLPPDDYSVTISDANNCTSTATTTINPFGCGLFNITLQTMDVTSFGGNNGAATPTVTGDNPPFTFNWSTGSTSSAIDNLIAGNYSLTVSDNVNCDTILNFEIIEPDTFIVVIDVTDESANNANDGKATATASGGVPPYSFLWGNGETTPTICDLAPGNVEVTVTDSNGNIVSGSASINAFGCDDIIITSQKSDVTCFGLGDGMASASATGGIEPYSFSWSNGSMNDNIDNLFPGTYFVTVLDVSNCFAIDTIEILEPELLEISVTSTDVTTVNGNDGSAIVNINGGTPNFSILWENGETTETINALTTGTYGVTVTDENNCTDTGIATINEPNSTINLALSTQMVTCNENNDGTATVIATDGIEPYTYLWNNGETTPTITGLEAGNYSVEVMDASGNSQFAGVTISEPSPLVLSFAILTQTCEGEMTGSAEVMAFGGTEPHNFLWENGQTDPIGINLPAGEISVTVTDVNGCSATTIIDIPEIAIPTANLQGDFEICEGGSWNLPIILSGNPPFQLTYLAGNQEITVSSNSTFFPLNVSPTETTVYTLVSISDENGCLNDNLNGTATVTVNNLPIIQNVMETPSAETYIVSFEVTNSSQFSVSGNATTINGNMVTSAPIPCDNDYNFTVTNDCGNTNISGMGNCGDDCITDAGSLNLTQITVCEGLTVSAIHNSDQFLDIGDLLQFALLSENGNFPFNILAIQNSPDFENLAAGNYQISAIAGEDDGSGTTNLSDPCLDVSDAVQITVSERPFEPISLQWQDTLCSGSDLVLITDTYPFGTDYHWILPDGSEIITDSASLVIPDISQEGEGFYNVYVGIGNCVSESFEEAGYVEVIDVGVMNDTIPACGTDEALLEAANIDFGIGVWSNPSTNAIIAEPLNSTTLVNNLAVGENLFIWTVASDLCNLSDTSWVFFNPEVVVNNDSFIMEATSLTLAFDPFQNDGLDNFDDSDIDITIISEPEFGEVVMENGLMEYTRENELEGDVFILYEICSQSPLEACESACDTATIKITVYFDPNIPLASRGVTPNDDGANDIWKILNIHQNPNNQVVITNRWGDVVFQRTGYRNEEGNAWDGRYNGNILPQGAYYFVIETNPSGEENVVLTGTVYLIL